MTKILSLLLCCFLLRPCYAQQKKLDSLKQELNNHPNEDTLRLDILNAITSGISSTDPQKGLELGGQAILLARKLQDSTRLALAIKNKGLNYWSMGEDSLALLIYGEALAIYERIAQKTGIAKVSHNMGLIYSKLGSYYKALEYHKRSAQLLNELGDKINMCNALNSMGVNYNYLSDYPRALECYLQSMNIYEQLADTQGLGMANVMVNIGIVYNHLSNFPKSLFFQEKALHIYQQTGNKQGMANAYGNLGSLYDNLSNPKKSLDCYQNALSLNQVIGDKQRIASDLTNIGVLYNGLADYISAFSYLQKAITLYNTLGDDNNSSEALAEMGKTYCYLPSKFLEQQGIDPAQRYIKAIGFQNRALRIARETGSLISQSTAMEYLSKSFEATKNYPQALKAYKQYIIIRDSIYNEEKQVAITRREMQYDFDKKEALVKAGNNKRQALAIAEIKRQHLIKNAAMGGAGILILAGLSSFVFYKKKRDADGLKKEAEFKSQVTDTEMKALRSQMNPHFIFNSLNSISDYMAKHDLGSANRYLSKFAKLMRIILENSEHREVPLSEDLNALEIYMQLESIRLQHKFTYTIQVDETIDQELTLVPPLILQPFVENSIWHGISKKEGLGQIKIEIKKVDNMINCIVEDNGVGRSASVTVKPGIKNEGNKSFGMKITNARIDIINRIKKTKAAVELTDLEEGTRVELRLPLELAF